MLLTSDENGQFSLLHRQTLATRSQPILRPDIAAAGDLTQNGLTDAVLWDDASGHSFVLTSQEGTFSLLPLPESCQGSLAIMDLNGDGLLEVVRDGCVDRNGRISTQWNGRSFTILP